MNRPSIELSAGIELLDHIAQAVMNEPPSIFIAIVDPQPLLEQAAVDGLRDRLAPGEVLLLGLRLKQPLG